MLELLSPALVDGDHDRLSDAELLDAYEGLRRRIGMLEAEAAAMLAAIDRRRSWQREGYLSTVAFVAHRCGDTTQTAAGRVRVARSLTDMPATRAAFDAGDIDLPRVRRLVDAHDDNPGRFARMESDLVAAAAGHDASRFAMEVEMWRQTAAPTVAADRDREQHTRRRLTITDRLDGMIHLDADLDPASGATVITAIASLAGPAGRDRGDGRTPTQRRHDALVEIARRHLDEGDLPRNAGRTPHLDVVVDLDTLHGPTRQARIGDRPLGPAAIAFFACDATVARVATAGPEILDMGRRVRTATTAQRHALALRDQGCVIPGCGRPPDWCDAHHLLPWIDGGLTNLDQLALVCRPHHMMIHLGELELPKRE